MGDVMNQRVGRVVIEAGRVYVAFNTVVGVAGVYEGGGACARGGRGAH
jgi:hypothetical protein